MRPLCHPNIPAGAAVVSVAKGIEVDTLLSPTDIIIDCIGPVPVACLSGPSIAPEVAARCGTGGMNRGGWIASVGSR